MQDILHRHPGHSIFVSVQSEVFVHFVFDRGQNLVLHEVGSGESNAADQDQDRNQKRVNLQAFLVDSGHGEEAEDGEDDQERSEGVHRVDRAIGAAGQKEVGLQVETELKDSPDNDKGDSGGHDAGVEHPDARRHLLRRFDELVHFRIVA